MLKEISHAASRGKPARSTMSEATIRGAIAREVHSTVSLGMAVLAVGFVHACDKLRTFRVWMRRTAERIERGEL